jgi:hypothetical protein
MYRFLMTMLLPTVGALALGACYPTHNVGGEPPPVAVYVAKEACEIDALAKERETYVERIDHHVVKDTDQSHTILDDKLREYRAEIEASYRFVTANCNNYNLCMQAHAFHEEACSESRAAWVSSHEKFNELAENLNRGNWWGPPPPHPPHHPGHEHQTCQCDGPFATGCCYDGD